MDKLVKDFSINKILQSAFCLAMGVLTLIALSFTLQKVDVLTVVFKENGFDLLDMKSIFISEEFAWGSALIGSFGILQLCLSLVTIVISVVSFFIFSILI